MRRRRFIIWSGAVGIVSATSGCLAITDNSSGNPTEGNGGENAQMMVLLGETASEVPPDLTPQSYSEIGNEYIRKLLRTVVSDAEKSNTESGSGSVKIPSEDSAEVEAAYKNLPSYYDRDDNYLSGAYASYKQYTIVITLAIEE